MSIELPHTDFYIDSNGSIYYDGGVVVNDGNALYQAYLSWVEEGNTPRSLEDSNAAE
jgi:hypothetical protein